MRDWKRIGLALTVIASPAYAQTADAVARVTAYHAALAGIVKARLGLPARIAAFAPVVRDYYDMPVIAQLVVGPAWAGWSATDRAAAIAALSHHSAVSLARNFDGHDPLRFTVAPAAIDRGTSQLVTVTIGGDTLVYRMRRGRIVDVVSGGVSQLAIQRADLAATVAAGPTALVRTLARLDAAR